MVDSQRPSRGKKGSLNPQTATALAVLPPLGYKPPPTLIGFKTIEPSVIALRVKNYNRAYKTLSINNWNTYVPFGIQDFVGPDEYLSHKAQESAEAGHLRVARYYRYHLENHAKIDDFLMKSISAVETSLVKSHPGFFDMSLKDMDLYLLQLNSPEATPMDIEKETSSLAAAAKTRNDDPIQSPSPLLTQQERTQDVSDSEDSELPTSQESIPFSPVCANKQRKMATSDSTTATPKAQSQELPAQKPLSSPVLHVKRPTKITANVIRMEARWAPKDFNELQHSTSKMHLRLAPILSCFNNEHTWLMEWQTDQMPENADIDPNQLSQYLSIQVVPVAKDQCFYFSFRVHGSGKQFQHTLASKVFSIAKRGENLHVDPSFVPTSQGKLNYIGDILLKDASVTHRGQYLQYLRKEVLPPDTPIFDIKYRRSNPTGSRINILSVRCGKSMSTKLAEILSTALCGEGSHPEIFISRLAIGANQTSKHDHEQIYKVHNEFLEDASHLLFSASAAIDNPVTEFLESGETVIRTP
jgi:hypothetical protein